MAYNRIPQLPQRTDPLEDDMFHTANAEIWGVDEDLNPVLETPSTTQYITKNDLLKYIHVQRFHEKMSTSTIGAGIFTPDNSISNDFRVTLAATGVFIDIPNAVLDVDQNVSGIINVIGGDTFQPYWSDLWNWGDLGEPTLTASVIIGYMKVYGDSTVLAWYGTGY